MPRTKKNKFKRAPIIALLIIAAIVLSVSVMVSSNTLKIKIINASQETVTRPVNFKELTTSASTETSLSSKKTVLFFTSSWCGSCGVYISAINEDAVNYDEINFFEVNIDDNRDLANKYDVALTPSLVFIDGNSHTTVSDISLDQIKSTISRFSLRGVDAI